MEQLEKMVLMVLMELPVHLELMVQLEQQEKQDLKVLMENQDLMVYPV